MLRDHKASNNRASRSKSEVWVLDERPSHSLDWTTETVAGSSSLVLHLNICFCGEGYLLLVIERPHLTCSEAEVCGT